MAFGLELKVERLRAGVLQYEIAAALGVTPQFVSMVEIGRKTAPPDFEKRYRAALKRLRRTRSRKGGGGHAR